MSRVLGPRVIRACNRRPTRRCRTSEPSRARTDRGPCRCWQFLQPRSCVTVMMSQPISSACTMLSTSRGLAQRAAGCRSCATRRVMPHDRQRVYAGIGDGALRTPTRNNQGRWRVHSPPTSTCSTVKQRGDIDHRARSTNRLSRTVGALALLLVTGILTLTLSATWRMRSA